MMSQCVRTDRTLEATGRAIRHELARLCAAGEVTPSRVLKDPYILDFLGLDDRYLERDLEDANLRELECSYSNSVPVFLSLPGRSEFSWTVSTSISIFFSTTVSSGASSFLELKQGNFRPEYKGQMELYLRWLAKYETEDGEASPIGISLCADKSSEQVELLELGAAGIHVAENLTVLPPSELLARKLHEAIASARLRFEGRELENS